MIRRLLLAVAVAVACAAPAAAAAPPMEPTPVDHVAVAPGEGLWSVAARLCPHDVTAQFQALQQANPWYTVGLHPGTIVHVPVGSCPRPPIFTTTTTTTTPASTVPQPACPGEPNMPDGPDPWGGCWPGEHNTGVPDGVTLTPHTESCTLSAGSYDAVYFGCNVVIAGPVTITRSHIDGTVRVLAAPAHLTISDSFVDAAPGGQVLGVTGINASSSGGATITRVEVVGGNRSVMCDPCTLIDSYLHGQRIASPMHASSIRASQDSTIVHSTLWCEPPKAPPEGGCSANLTGYPDFEPTTRWEVRRNLIMSGDGLSFCAFGGNSSRKPYSEHPDNATYIRFVDNVFRRDAVNGHGYPDCGLNGNDRISAAIVAFDATGEGNVWEGNVWADDGSPIPPRD